VKFSIVTNTQNIARRFSEDLIALAFRDVLVAMGHSVVIQPYSKLRSNANAWIFVCGAKYIETLESPPNGLKIVLNAERMPYNSFDRVKRFEHLGFEVELSPVDLSKNLGIMDLHHSMLSRLIDRGFIDVIFDYNPHNVEYWGNYGGDSFFVPLGYHSRFRMKRAGQRKGVLMLGTKTPWRGKLAGKNVVYPKSSADRNWMLGSFRVGIDLPQFEGYDVFADRRMALYGSNDYVIISPKGDWTPVGADWFEEGVKSEFYKKQFRLEDHFSKVIGEVL
jgi:hypothetical protein